MAKKDEKVIKEVPSSLAPSPPPFSHPSFFLTLFHVLAHFPSLDPKDFPPPHKFNLR